MVKMSLTFRLCALLICVVTSGAYSVDRALAEAERLADIGAIDEAVTEYRRYLFFNPDSSPAGIYTTIAELYKNSGQFAQARAALESALFCAASDSGRDWIRMETALVDMAARKYPSAQLELVRLNSFSKQPDMRNRARRLLCFVRVMTGEWGAIEKMTQSGGGEADPAIRLMDSIARDGNRLKRKSPGTARLLSTVVPGLGQVYAGEYLDGLNALVISCATGFLTVHALVYGYYQEAFFTDITLLWRYYSGNRWNAAQAANDYNGILDQRVRTTILRALQNREDLE